MTRHDHPIEPEDLMAYMDGELPVDRATVAAAHLEHCRECQGIANELRGLSQRLLAWEIHVPEFRPKDQPAAKTEKRGWRLWGTVAVTACMLLVLGPAVYLFRPMPDLKQAHETSYLVAPVAIAYTTQMTLTAADFDKSRSDLESAVSRHNAHFAQLSVTSPSNAARTLEGSIRVPADQLSQLMAELRQLGRVESESESADDVTKESIDLDARLTNAHNTEQRLTALLRDRTGSLSDVLAVEKEIDEVRGRIEQMEAQKKTLVNRVDFATIAIKITEERRDFRIVPILGLLVLLAALAYSTRAVLMKSRFGKWFRR